jgi:hypothetical protein
VARTQALEALIIGTEEALKIALGEIDHFPAGAPRTYRNRRHNAPAITVALP